MDLNKHFEKRMNQEDFIKEKEVDNEDQNNEYDNLEDKKNKLEQKLNELNKENEYKPIRVFNDYLKIIYLIRIFAI